MRNRIKANFLNLQLILGLFGHQIGVTQTIRNMAPNWSPNSNELAYYSNKDGNNEIYILNLKTKRHTRITRNERSDVLPKFSPEGTRLLYFTGEKGDHQLMIYDLVKKKETQITKDGTNNEDPSWVSETSVIFNSDRTGNHELFMMNLETRRLEQLTQNPLRDFTPDISKNRILFVRGQLGKETSIYLMNKDDSEQRKVTTLNGDYTPTWAFPPEKFFFMSRCCGGIDIYEWDLTSDTYRRITTHSGNDLFPSGSPDGMHLAFSSNRDTGSYELYLMDLQSGDIERLTFDSKKD